MVAFAEIFCYDNKKELTAAMDKIRKLLIRYREIILYGVFGVMTTVVNWVVYFAMFNNLAVPAVACAAVAWAVSVLFAFVTNKPFVFQSKDWSAKVVWPEFLKFVGCRIGSGLLEILLIYVFVDQLLMSGVVMKFVISVLVVIINYVGSKLLFKK